MDENVESSENNTKENDQNVEAATAGGGTKQDAINDETEQVKKDSSNSHHSLASQKEVKEVEELKQETDGDEATKEEGVKETENVEKEATAVDELEEYKYVEEPPPDPAAPYNFTDSTEALKPPFELRPDQLAELEELWDLYQDYTPAYTDINGYITEKELVYMLKSLFLMTHTPEQLQELIAFCVRPPHPEGHIDFDQFVKMATIRYRDISIEDNLRSALLALEEGEGLMNREHMKEILTTMGHKMAMKQLNLLIKEVDIRNDGLIGIEDVMATICIDLIFE